ncbi:MAG: hypothetical protein WCJ24_02240 [Candidatus Saccharibacteria bacterium]
MSGERVSFRDSLQIKAVALGLVLASVAISAGCAGEHQGQDGQVTAPTTASVDIGEALTETGPGYNQICIEPTDQDMASVDALLAQPENPVVTRQIGGAGGGKGVVTSAETPDQIFQDFLEQSAREDNLTIYNGMPILDKLTTNTINSVSDVTPGPFSKYLLTAQQFMDQLGVTVAVGTPDLTYSYGGRAPTASELEDYSAKETRREIIEGFSNEPKELVQLAGLKHIVIMTGTAKQDVAGYVQARGDEPHDTLYVDIEQGDSTPIGIHNVRHEISHLIDLKQCGPVDMFKDANFAALNGAQNIYVPGVRHDLDHTSLMGFESYVTSRQKELQSAEQSGDKTALCQINQQINEQAASVLTYSDYHENPAEGKAELLAEILSPNGYVDLADPRHAVLYRQFKLELGRLYHLSPAIAKFLIDQARRPTPDPLEAQC